MTSSISGPGAYESLVHLFDFCLVRHWSRVVKDEMAEALVNKAKLAEQAERYEDMAKVLTVVCYVQRVNVMAE